MADKLASQIRASLETDQVSDVSVDGKTVDFRLGGVWYWARLSRGNFNPDNMRRAI